MAASRKDSAGRTLRSGECQRKQDGRYVYTYTSPYDGKRKYVYARTLADLREKEHRLLVEQALGAGGENPPLNNVFDRWIETKTGLKERTRLNYVGIYDRLARCGIGERRIGDIRYSDVLALYRHLVYDKNLKTGTVNCLQAILHQVFRFAVRDGLIVRNPCDDAMCELRGGETRKRARHALTPEQQRIFLRYVRETPEYASYWPLFVFMFGTGCRAGEVAGLKWEDVDFNENILHVRRGVSYVQSAIGEDGKAHYEYVVDEPKTEAGVRDIPLMQEVRDALETELQQQQAVGLQRAEAVCQEATGQLFRNARGETISMSYVNIMLRKIQDSYNAEEEHRAEKDGRSPEFLPHFSCHHFRHTFCTRLCENEANIKVIQEIMGHANIATTMDIYAEATGRKKHESIENLEKVYKLF